ncbi:RNA-binding protein [Schizosaccharomyces octosporus yFS286]|uniref:RNA-binding protein n=1 Tax=Schizosaccharomyces octosporus (strain yFS286) TaxID=483514 RepID=S9Q4I9_SCHOY|nr:RNA-binding protein [Schizosaccharomyces octosporus yFS286]EPX74553.1 RNA-binding protein [Schizosaccharomyces octosporus yFS286]
MAYLSNRHFLDASPSLSDPSSLFTSRSSVQLSSSTHLPIWEDPSFSPHQPCPSTTPSFPQQPSSQDPSSRFFSSPSSQIPASKSSTHPHSHPPTSVFADNVTHPSKLPWRSSQVKYPLYNSTNSISASVSPSQFPPSTPSNPSPPSLSNRWTFQPLRANSLSHDHHALDLSLDSSSFKPDPSSTHHSFSPPRRSLSNTPLLDPLSSSTSSSSPSSRPLFSGLQALSIHDPPPLKPSSTQRTLSNPNIQRYSSHRKSLNNTLLNNSRLSQHSTPINHLLRNMSTSPSFSLDGSEASLTPMSLSRSIPNSPVETDSVHTPSLCSSSDSLAIYPETKVNTCPFPTCPSCKTAQFLPQLSTQSNIPSFLHERNSVSNTNTATSSDPSYDGKPSHYEAGQRFLYRNTNINRPSVSRDIHDVTSIDENVQPLQQAGKHKKPEDYKPNTHKKYTSNKLKNMEFPSLEEMLGRIPSICKDQHGCRYLQKLLDENPKTNASLVYDEVVSSIVELMKDPFGNYMCQKLFVYAYREQKLAMLKGIGKDVVGINSDLHGTRAMQNIIDKLTSNEQISLLMRILTPFLVELACDGNGNHVLQKCIDKFLPEKLELLFFSIKRHVLKLATHRHGCCVLQRSLDATKGLMKNQLVEEIISHALFLVQDPYGNYVIQHILEMNVEQYNASISQQFQGHICELSLQKFSSNAVEDCIRTASPSTRKWILDEFLSYPKIEDLLNDSYANYVMQSFLIHSNDEEREKIVHLLVPLLPKISASSHGRHIIGKITEYAKA